MSDGGLRFHSRWRYIDLLQIKQVAFGPEESATLRGHPPQTCGRALRLRALVATADLPDIRCIHRR